jgi:hypothetical protein
VTAIIARTLEKKEPRVLHASRDEYLIFPLTIFRNHYYKELIGRNESSYWIVLKKEKKQAKLNRQHQQQAKQAKKSNKNSRS